MSTGQLFSREELNFDLVFNSIEFHHDHHDHRHHRRHPHHHHHHDDHNHHDRVMGL